MLHRALTVVTFGNVCRSFCGGPAYIHVSMLDDPWSKALGATAATPSPNADTNGGRDAVYFHALSPYEYSRDGGRSDDEHDAISTGGLRAHNAHNPHACGMQFLALIMRINGIRSFRALYDAARYVDPTAVLDIDPSHFAVNYGKHGDLVIPPRMDDELLPAMIRATGGDRWLWRNDDGDDEDFESFVPDEIEATSHLEESFGYSAYEEIHDTCFEVASKMH